MVEQLDYQCVAGSSPVVPNETVTICYLRSWLSVAQPPIIFVKAPERVSFVLYGKEVIAWRFIRDVIDVISSYQVEQSVIVLSRDIKSMISMQEIRTVIVSIIVKNGIE